MEREENPLRRLRVREIGAIYPIFCIFPIQISHLSYLATVIPSWPDHPEKPLKPQHALFVASYCKHRNKTQAALDAGYAKSSASVQGYKLSQNPIIAAAIAAHDAQAKKNSETAGQSYARAELTEAKLKAALNELVDFDPAEMYGEDGELLEIPKMPVHTRKAIAGFEESLGKLGGKDRKFRLSSRLQAIELASKFLGLLKSEPQQQAVQIIIAAPPEVAPTPTPNGKLLPRWE
jgi:hypothetical protein